MPSEIQRGEIKQKISEELGFNNPSLSPNHIPDYIVPVLLINDDLYSSGYISETGTAINSTSTTILTTDSFYYTYLTGITLSVAKDSTATSTLSTVTAVIDGATKTIGAITGLTLTAQNQTIDITFTKPLKLDRSSIITITNSTAVSNVTARAVVRGFLRRPN